MRGYGALEGNLKESTRSELLVCPAVSIGKKSFLVMILIVGQAPTLHSSR